MSEQKPKVWILEEDLANQFLFSELLEEKYDLIFFDTVESMQLYRVATKNTAHLIVANVLAAEQGLRTLLAQGSDCAVLMLSPQNMPQVVTDKYRMYVSEILYYPYSQSQVCEAVERLTSGVSTEESFMNLIRFDNYRGGKKSLTESFSEPGRY
jgi:DNA-binding NarL/FixJ family response regulator